MHVDRALTGSVVAVGVDQASDHLPPLEHCRALIVGTGSYAGATVADLRARGLTDIAVYSASNRAEAFAAVSSGDNSNIIAARVARETFGVERVVARIYDAKRAAVYERLGIPTVATVPWTTDRFLHTLIQDDAITKWRDPSGAVAVAQLNLHEDWYGRTVTDLEIATGSRVAFIVRFGMHIHVWERFDSWFRLITALYFTQYLGVGFLTIGLVAILRDGGTSLATLGMLQTIGLIWPLKFLWAPLVDRFGSRAVVIATVLMGWLAWPMTRPWPTSWPGCAGIRSWPAPARWP